MKMKNICSIVLMIVLFFLPLCSCAAGPGSGVEEPSGENPGAEQPEENSDNGKKSISVFLPFWTPGPNYGGLDDRIETASKILSETYGVEVERYLVPGYEDASMEEIALDSSLFYDRLYTEIMAGKGPDVFFLTWYSALYDLEKKMQSGAFYDLNEFIENDPEFDLGEYEEIILNGGVFGGKRYIMPLSYNVNMLVTSKEKLALGGFTSEDFSTYERFISAWEEIQRGGNLRLMNGIGEWGSVFGLGGWLDECVDFEAGTADFSLWSFERVLNLERNELILDADTVLTHSNIFLEDRLFTDCQGAYDFLFPPASDMSVEDVEIFPVPNAYGNSTAHMDQYCMISSSAKNPENAWLFLKALLSDEVQEKTLSADVWNITVKSEYIDGAVEAQFEKQSRVFGSKRYDDGFIGRMKEIYHTYDNIVVPGSNSVDTRIYEYIYNLDEHSGQGDYKLFREGDSPYDMPPLTQQDFDAFREEMAEYFSIYMSE